MKPWTIPIGIFVLWAAVACETVEDPYRWLDEVEGEEALAWVAAHNEQTLEALRAHSAFDSIYQKNLEIEHRAQERARPPDVMGEYAYELWQDEEHERGLWRRTTLDSYLTGDPAWETLLNVDSLAEAEGQDWVFSVGKCLPPEFARFMVRLSRGGRDAAEAREFDVEKKAFVEGGFVLPEARNSYEWKDANTLLVATDFGEGTTTEFGWPRLVKEWERGTSLEDAKVLFEADSSDVYVWPVIERGPDRSYILIVQEWLARKEYDLFALENDRAIRLDIPPDPVLKLHAGTGQLIILPRSDWIVGDTTYPQEALLSIEYSGFLEGDRDFEVIFDPDGRSHVGSFVSGDDGSSLIVWMLRDGQWEPRRFRRDEGRWVPEDGVPEDQGADNSFLTPPKRTLTREDGTVVATMSPEPEFDVESFIEHRYEATSRDGTRIPYFIVHLRNLERDGDNPTLLYGYGGYNESMTPSYDPILGTAWLERGGVYVLAQIRGGGEYGPSWHQAALREGRQRSFDDFIAVAEDLIARGITSPEHLGIMGASNGGLLVAAVLTQRPDLFGAVVCLNPILDLSKADEFPDGGAEFGDPNNPYDWAYMEKLSPYHNLSREEHYPKVLFMTSRTDDRVGPGHARRMAAKMEDMGHPVFFYEFGAGGHLGRGDVELGAFREALIYTYLLDRLR